MNGKVNKDEKLSTRNEFLLEKRPNLLNCTLLVPIISSQSSEEDALKLVTKIGQAKTVGLPPKLRRECTAGTPHMSIELSKDRRKSLVKILVRYSENEQPQVYVEVNVDCPLDLDRSALTVQGDHLAARLSFSDYSSARDIRNDLQNYLENACEIDADVYWREGIRCRSCSQVLLEAGHIRDAFWAAKLPWTELLECLTCVKPEVYKSSETADIAFSHSASNLHLPKDAISVSMSFIEVSFDVTNSAFATCKAPSSYQSTLVHEGDEGIEEHKQNSIVYCSSCNAWLGEANCGDNVRDRSCRLWKSSVRVGDLFNRYHMDSILCGVVLNAARIRECYRFVVGCAVNESVRIFLRLILLSTDTCISHSDNPNLCPALKFLFWDCTGSDDLKMQAVNWAKRTSAETILFPSEQLCHLLRDLLHSSNRRFPHSMRKMHDGSSIGFLYI